MEQTSKPALKSRANFQSCQKPGRSFAGYRRRSHQQAKLLFGGPFFHQHQLNIENKKSTKVKGPS